MFIPCFVYPFVYSQTHFHLLIIMNNATVNMGVKLSVRAPAFTSFVYAPRSGIAGSYGSSIFNFLRDCYAVFHSGCTICHSHRQCTGFQSLHTFTNTLSIVCFCFFFIVAVLMGVTWYLVVLICTSLMISDVEHLYRYFKKNEFLPSFQS